MSKVKKVVLIEDDPFFRVMIADRLTLQGFEVTTAVDASQGLQQAVAVQPDCILCHAKLPSSDGRTILAQLRRHVSTAKIPFLLLDAKGYLDNRRYDSPLNVGLEGGTSIYGQQVQHEAVTRYL